jgi:hypothetical protein
MDFTPKNGVRSAVRGILAIAVVGLISSVSHVASAPAPVAASHDAFAYQGSFPTSNALLVIPAVERSRTSDLRTAGREYYQPVSSWYKNKHWWKRNAPIVGGAGGGALIGGLAGGGTGALIGGAVGGGGGYAYKHYRHHHHH